VSCKRKSQRAARQWQSYEKEMKKPKKHGFSFAFRPLVRTFGLRPKVVTFDKAKKKKWFSFGFVPTYSYLWPAAEGTHVRQSQKEKVFFIWLCAHLFVPLQAIYI